MNNVVSFTEKTRFLFNVQKGLVGEQWKSDPFAVNKKFTEDEIAVPFHHMIFVGDGLTDVPCFSLIRNRGGRAFGIYDRESKKSSGKMAGLIREQRVSQPVNADYRKHSGLDNAIRLAINVMTGSGQYA
jgi:hypothetical protein